MNMFWPLPARAWVGLAFVGLCAAAMLITWPALSVFGLPQTLLSAVVVGRRQASWAAVAFGVVTSGVSAFFHLAFVYDLDQLATGSSTSAIIFMFTPFLALGLGLAAAIAVALGGWIAGRLRAREG